MDNLKKIGIRYIRMSAFLVLFFLVLYVIFALGGLFTGPFYTTWGIVSYILLQILLPVYGGFLLFFVLYLLAEMLEKFFQEM